MIISPKHKLIFFKSIKTAGSSVEKALHSILDENAFCAGGYNQMTKEIEYKAINNEFELFNNNGEKEIHSRFHQHVSPESFFTKIKHPKVYDGYKKITVVRNPWDMAVSYYWYSTTLNPERFVTKDLSCLIHNSDSKTTTRKKFKMWLLGSSNYTSHLSAIEHPEGEFLRTLEFLQREQESFVDDKYITDYMRFEKLERHWKALCAYVGHPSLELPRLKTNAQKAKQEHYSYFYDSTSVKLIQFSASKLIDKFGYTFDRRVK